MIIRRKGLIYCPDGKSDWAISHAMNPTIDLINSDTIRIYYSSLDKYKRGRIGYVDVNVDNPQEILNISDKPILELGNLGTFDSSGMVPSSVVTNGNTKYLYYYGFQLVQDIRFMIYTGLAVSYNGGKTFERYSKVPILDRTDTDPFIRSLPQVSVEGDLWRLWYTGVDTWTNVLGKVLPIGNIRYTQSYDGIHFDNFKTVNCLSPEADEFSLSRAFVFPRNNKYNMLFSRRMRETDNYRLGFAESEDGINWHRNDRELVIEDSAEKWDSRMICYTSLVQCGGKSYLFYNGNGFGETGFGYAEVEY
jgi:hypothetical protein